MNKDDINSFHPLLQIVKKYILYLQFERRLSVNTSNSYYNDLKKYSDFLFESFRIKKPEKIYKTHIDKYIDSCLKYLPDNKKEKYKGSSLSRNLSSIKGFHDYLLMRELINKNPIEEIDFPKISKKIPIVLSIKEINQLLDTVKSSEKSSLRDYCIVLVLYATGIRVSELINLSLIDFIADENVVRIIGKGNKERIVPMSTRDIDCINQYIVKERAVLCRKANSSGYLFLNNRGNKISRVSIWKILKKYTLLSGLSKEVSPHTIRHTFATHLIQGGANLRIVQELLGHADISTTQIYTHLNKNNLIDIYNKYHPRS